jgi:hypothetical protein
VQDPEIEPWHKGKRKEREREKERKRKNLLLLDHYKVEKFEVKPS